MTTAPALVPLHGAGRATAGVWWVAPVGSSAPEHRAKDGRFVDTWPAAWLPVLDVYGRRVPRDMGDPADLAHLRLTEWHVPCPCGVGWPAMVSASDTPALPFAEEYEVRPGQRMAILYSLGWEQADATVRMVADRAQRCPRDRRAFHLLPPPGGHAFHLYTAGHLIRP